ncbi:quinolinate synthase NadA [Sandaracinus amylolyticus]|uniref:quinolinate synthase n=1 Tax=Sandaracinus amylolyticus TaxID=927083 RepID=A0A0F6W267_9BACT|nr:quinolinate synthase NadA [Sandaracinus amylolyticus]AKF05511.1 Quinolinate synthetase [Sandaracinus amylolyticus]
MSTSRTFPSLRVLEDRFEAEGAFAEAQAEYLQPDPAIVRELDALLAEKKIGVVAHFYMDPQLQGVLASCTWPHIHISDSLVMADRAVAMAEAGCRSIIVLGVDFMSENARAMLDKAGLQHVPVYRVAAEAIGCSLAAAADTMTYQAWLTKAAKTPRALHVVYINTSLRTKARAHSVVPTITCTSSNVVQTVLTAFAEIPEVHVFFGPDTYMGRNLGQLFASMSEMSDEEIRKVHPAHSRATIAKVRERFAWFEQGHCIVHHMFGEDVVRRVREEEKGSFVTAHLEVPGEMFELALEAREADRGVVGSTSDILGFITRKVKGAVARGGNETLRFVLGTEAGMITSIVREAQKTLRAHAGSGVAVEIAFPVASEAIAATGESDLAIVPGVSGGEGCSTAGGCATCPYMKMNSLDALIDLVRRLDVADDDSLASFHPKSYVELVEGRTAADIGGVPILHMRHFSKTGHLSPELVEDVTTRHERRAARAATA